MHEPSRAIRLFGTEEVALPPRLLQAGPLSAQLEAGNLRAIRWHGVEVIRGIAYLLRDANWATPPAVLSDLEVARQDDGFVISYAARVANDEVDFAYQARIVGEATGRLEFTVEGEALRPFQTNRTGFVVLHPVLGVAGAPATIEHTDGSREDASFPALVSPGQPMFDIRALTNHPVDGVTVTCRMEAELPHDPAGKFEMEDQRNWSDASYKTYVGSLLDPWPYRMEPGRRWRQRITVECRGEPTRTQASAGGARLRIGDATGLPLPAIGLGLDPATAGAALGAAPSLARLGVRHLTAWADLADSELGTRLADYRALAEALRAQVQLELVLPCAAPPAGELGQAAELCRRHGLAVAAVLPCPAAYLKSYQPSGPWPDLPELAEIYAAARSAFPGVAVGGGMLSYFTELNRKRPPAEAIDFISHTVAPVVHAADDRTVFENLEALPSIAASVRAIAPGVPYRLGPSAVGMRHNPYGAGLLPNPKNQRIAMATSDPRQRGLLAAAWTIGHAAALAEAGLAILTINHATGASGVVASPGPDPRPWFEEEPGARVYPVFHAMRMLARGAGRPLLAVEGAQAPLAAIAWTDAAGGRTLLVANLGPEPVEVALAEPGTAHILDAASFCAAVGDPDWLETDGRAATRRLELDAYGVAQVALPAAGRAG